MKIRKFGSFLPIFVCCALLSTPIPSIAPAFALQAQPAGMQTFAPAVQPSHAGERELLDRINRDRSALGLAALRYDAALSHQARLHAQDMARGSYLSHTSPTRGSFARRLEASGIRTLGAGENIARYASLQKAHAALMASRAHRANLMHPQRTHIGIGIARDAQGIYFIVEWTATLP